VTGTVAAACAAWSASAELACDLRAINIRLGEIAGDSVAGVVRSRV
jgi:hypothetical protein